jgi:mannobiose 2-epimerase
MVAMKGDTVHYSVRHLAIELEKELQNILGFWVEKTVDHRYGGFIGRMTFSGELDEMADKGAVLNCRILWTFSAAYRVYRKSRYKEMADRSFRYIMDHFWDHQEGGLIWSVNYLGEPVSSRKQGYAQGFGIYAFSEYNRATGDLDGLEYAKQLVDIVEEKLWDPRGGGYLEALDKAWGPMEDMRLSEKDMNYPKSMNTHLHILEPYANLYRIWPDPQLKRSILALLDIFQDRIMDPVTGHFNLFFAMDWSVMSDIVSYGHDVEGAWLMHEAARLTGDSKVIDKAKESAMRLVNATVAEGMDSDGSVFNELKGTHLDTDKDHWPQAEAMVGLMDAWEITGKEEYLEKVISLWKYIKNTIIDHRNGEWYLKVDRDGLPYENQDKVGFWKCPYHNSRSLIELMNRIEKMDLLAHD